MYGLPQAGLLAQQRLIAHLANHGYHETSTSCLFWHTCNGTAFTLVVDDFVIKYSSKAGADHLIRTLQLLYVITINWTGFSYIEFTIVFNNISCQVSLTMPGYISKVLERFAPHLCLGAASPAVYIPPSYGAPTQTVTSDNSSLLPPLAIKRLQEQVGCLLYYARGVDATSSQPHSIPTISTYRHGCCCYGSPSAVLCSISRQCTHFHGLRYATFYTIRRFIPFPP